MVENRIYEQREKLDSFKQILTDNVTQQNNTNNEECQTLLREITDNVNAISAGNSLIQVNLHNKGGQVDQSTQLSIDYECLPEKIDECTNLLKSLVTLYLKQESLDQFLRITISNNKEDLLHIKSVQDPRYRNLESQVKILKEDNVDERDKEIKQLKDDIRNICQDILTTEEQMEDLMRSSERELDECSSLLKELEELEANRVKQMSKIESKEINEINEYERFIKCSNEVKLLTQEQKDLQEEVNRLHANGTSKQEKGVADTPRKDAMVLELKKIQNENKIMNKLVDIQAKHLLTNYGSNITDLKFIYSDSKKGITFQSQGKYNVEIILNVNNNSFDSVNIWEKKTNLRINELEKDVNDKFYQLNNIFQIINYTNNKLIHIKEGKK